MAEQSWTVALDGLPGLSTAEKGRARVMLLRNSQEQASLLVSGLPEVAAEAIKEILRQEGAAAGLGITRAGTGPEDYLTRLRGFLKEAHIDHPYEGTLQLIVRRLSSRLIAASSKETAIQLYEEARCLPGPSTEAQILEQNGLAVDGPISSSMPRLLAAMDAEGCPCVLKVLPPPLSPPGSALGAMGLRSNEAGSSSAASGTAARRPGGPEAAACHALCSGKPDTVPLVDAEVIEYTLGAKHKLTHGHAPGVYAAVRMPYYVSTVARLPPVPLRALPAAVQRMVEALEWIHSKNYVHMDVKADNIFIDAAGRWWLGDFGSAVLTGSAITSTTRWFAPPAATIAAAAAVPEFDWHMLAVAVVIEVLRRIGLENVWQHMLVERDCVPRAKLLAALDDLSSRQVDGAVLVILRDLMKRAEG